MRWLAVSGGASLPRLDCGTATVDFCSRLHESARNLAHRTQPVARQGSPFNDFRFRTCAVDPSHREHDVRLHKRWFAAEATHCKFSRLLM